MGKVRDAVIAELKRRKMSHTELAKLSGVSRPKIASWLGGTGDKLMREDSIERILMALGLEIRRGRGGGKSE